MPAPAAIANQTVLQLNLHTGEQPLAIATGLNLLQLDAFGTWQLLSNPPITEQYFGLETDWTPLRPARTIFVCTDSQIFSTTNAGITWNDIKPGLPTMPHCRDLQYIREPSGNEFLYLATFGWSIWRLRLVSVPDTPRTVQLASGNIGLLIRHTLGDDSTAQAITAQSAGLSASAPVAEMRVPRVSLGNVWVQLMVRWDLAPGGAVDVLYEADLNNTFSGFQVRNKGTFHLGPGEVKRMNVNLRDVAEDAESNVDFVLFN
jgi:hypothetical protein